MPEDLSWSHFFADEKTFPTKIVVVVLLEIHPELRCVICTGVSRWCYTFCNRVTLELHCSQPIRIECFFFHVYYYNSNNISLLQYCGWMKSGAHLGSWWNRWPDDISWNRRSSFHSIPFPVVNILEVPSIFIVFALSASIPPCPLLCWRHVRVQLLLSVTLS